MGEQRRQMISRDLRVPCECEAILALRGQAYKARCQNVTQKMIAFSIEGARAKIGDIVTFKVSRFIGKTSLTAHGRVFRKEEVINPITRKVSAYVVIELTHVEPMARRLLKMFLENNCVELAV